MRVTRHNSCWVSPFGNPRINARLTAPRGISQPPTSFIGSRCQGIHHVPLNTYFHTKTKSKITHINGHNTTRALHPFRCSQPLSNSQTPHPTTKMVGTTPKTNRVLPQDPIVCRQLRSSNQKNCCCAPDRRHYSARSHHGPHPRNWSALRGAP